MKCGVVTFPGSNCDQDCHRVLQEAFGVTAEPIWHKAGSVAGYDLIILPGGFSYGDYLRCGAIARYSPVMRSIIEEAGKGKMVLGICNGFQILCEAKLLPGALIRNRSLHFICETATVRLENIETAFTHAEAVRSDGTLLSPRTGTLLRLPIAHGEGNYVADAETLREMNLHRQIILRYVDETGATTAAGNPNGSLENIAGICNRAGNVFGLMPHPERAAEPRLGSEDGRLILESALISAGLKKP